jgi:hypothetical protein
MLDFGIGSQARRRALQKSTGNKKAAEAAE